MDMKTFKAALRRAWPFAILLFAASVFGSYIYAQKRIPPTAKASVVVRDALTINPSAYTAAQVSFDAVVKSVRLADMVQKAMGPGTPSLRGALSVEAVIPSNGINISPLYIVRAKYPNAKRALAIVNTAVADARALYIQLNKVDLSSVAAVDTQSAQATTQLQKATQSFNDYNVAHGGDVETSLERLRAEVASLDVLLSQAQGDLAAVQHLNDPAGRSAAQARVSEYSAQLVAVNTQLTKLEPFEPGYENLASALAEARTTVQQLGQERQALVSNASLPVGDQIKVLDNASMDSTALDEDPRVRAWGDRRAVARARSGVRRGGAATEPRECRQRHRRARCSCARPHSAPGRHGGQLMSNTMDTDDVLSGFGRASHGAMRFSEAGSIQIGRRPESDLRRTVFVDAFGGSRRRPSTAAIDAVRTLALTVDRVLSESNRTSVAVLSSYPGDGRSLTAELLARGLSEIRPPVRLLDADPFDATAADPVVAIDLVDDPAAETFAELTLGRGLFANQRDFLNATRTLLHRATIDGATVVIDVPACKSSSIAFAVAGIVGAAIYVARPKGEMSPAHAEVRAQLDLLGVHLLGVVFNER